MCDSGNKQRRVTSRPGMTRGRVDTGREAAVRPAASFFFWRALGYVDRWADPVTRYLETAHCFVRRL